MATMGSYVKAYAVAQFRAFPGWKERSDQARPADDREHQEERPRAPRTLADDDYLYLQENLTVTDGIYLDEHVIFDERTPEWERFCADTLRFEVPRWDDPVETEPAAAGARP